MKKLTSGGGWRAIFYTLKKSRQMGGLWSFWKAMRSKNACKTCALGMGGQKGGMVNEAGSFPEVCKKSLQAMAADMQGAIKPEFWSTYSIAAAAGVLAARAGIVRAAGAAGRCSKRGQQYYRPITWDDALGPHRRQARSR